jgi:phosphomannomutase
MAKDLMIGISGIRGIVGSGLTPEVISQFVLGFGTLMKGGKIVIGKDTRPSGEMVSHSVISGLLATGCDVIDLGVCPTPTVLFNVRKLNASGGIAITASHNPIEWNALKFISKDAKFLDRRRAEELITIYKKKMFDTVEWKKLGQLSEDKEGINRHIDEILSLSYLNIDGLKKRRFKVAVDCVNGAAFSAFPELLNRLGCNVVKVLCDDTGEFKRNPEPLAENLALISKTVKREKADVGFATDADGDRLSIVSDKGIPLGEEHSLPLAAKFILSKKKGDVVTNLSTSRMVDFVADENDSKLYRTKVGEANVVSKMEDMKAVIGGEGNGGIILPDVHYTRDALTGIALILQYMLETNKNITQLKNELPNFIIIKRRKNLESSDYQLDFDSIISRFPQGEVNMEDGIRIDWEEGWLHIRKSGTEPIVRIFAEAKTRKEAERICNKAMRII